MSEKTKTFILLIVMLVLAFTAGMGAGYLIRGTTEQSPIVIERGSGDN